MKKNHLIHHKMGWGQLMLVLIVTVYHYITVEHEICIPNNDFKQYLQLDNE